jgi:flagellar motor switch protein FliN/FliY
MATVATVKEIRGPEVGSTALVATPAHEMEALTGSMEAIEEHPQWALLSKLPMRLISAVPLPGFRVKDLLALRLGQIVASKWPDSEDVPLKIGAVQLSWSEFEVVEQRMAIRLTRLA